MNRHEADAFCSLADLHLRGYGSSARQLIGDLPAQGYGAHHLDKHTVWPPMSVESACVWVAACGYADLLFLP